jgi:2-methylisocitrate lyase-like PEP mutase family enzyme
VTSGTFRDLLAEPGCVVIPAVYDALSARIAERVGFRAVGLGGFLVAASRVGPDVGQLTMSAMVERVRGVGAAVSLPVLADGDTGYGNPLNVRRTVQACEAAGAQAIVFGGAPGHPDRRLREESRGRDGGAPRPAHRRHRTHRRPGTARVR